MSEPAPHEGPPVPSGDVVQDGGALEEGPFREDHWTAWLREQAKAHPRVVLGIGDDAAVLASARFDSVATTDVLIDGVHADVASVGIGALAYKAVAVNISDLAAMGATPRAILAGVVAPRGVDRETWRAFGEGLLHACRAFDVVLVGGDTNVADGPWTVAITALGLAPAAGVVRREGAMAGDVLSVSGSLGGSLRSGRHLRPRPRVALGAWLASAAYCHAMMDISDGLARDLPRLLHASGVGGRVLAASIPIHGDVPEGPDRVLQALCDGEDFELLVAHAPLDEAAIEALTQRGCRLLPIGRVIPHEDGLLLEGPTPEDLQPWPQGGYDHLAS